MGIRGHDYNVMRELKVCGTAKGNVYYGVELELEFPWCRDGKVVKFKEDAFGDSMVWENHSPNYFDLPCRCAKCLGVTNDLRDAAVKYIEGTGFILPKHDGSLKNGVELVSAPATVDVHRKKWEEILGDMDLYCPKASKNCGMHVHISKAPFSLTQRGDLHIFLNDKKTQPWLETIAGRTKNQFCYAVKKNRDQMGSYPQRKYEVFNLAPPYTMEVRIFASTTKYKVMMKNLEFCATLVEMVKSGESLEIERVEDFVKERKEMFPFLHKFLGRNCRGVEWKEKKRAQWYTDVTNLRNYNDFEGTYEEEEEDYGDDEE